MLEMKSEQFNLLDDSCLLSTKRITSGSATNCLKKFEVGTDIWSHFMNQVFRQINQKVDKTKNFSV